MITKFYVNMHREINLYCNKLLFSFVEIYMIYLCLIYFFVYIAPYNYNITASQLAISLITQQRIKFDTWR